MAHAKRTFPSNMRANINRMGMDDWDYPTGMVWCPMKMSGMAIMKCAELQKRFGCGTLRQFRLVSKTAPALTYSSWPWLRRGRDCPARPAETELRDLRMLLSPLKPVEKLRRNPRTSRCPACGGSKAFAARHCRRCWRIAVRKA
jgi:hypothetical protein